MKTADRLDFYAAAFAATGLGCCLPSLCPEREPDILFAAGVMLLFVAMCNAKLARELRDNWPV